MARSAARQRLANFAAAVFLADFPPSYDHTYIPVKRAHVLLVKKQRRQCASSLRSLLLLSSHLPPPPSAHFASLVAGAIEKAVSPEKTQVEVPPVEAVAPKFSASSRF